MAPRSGRHTNGKPSPLANILRPNYGTQRPPGSLDSSATPTHRPDDESNSDRQAHVIGMMIGTALMFIGFLDVFLSISGGFEINVVPLLIYFSGIAVWAERRGRESDRPLFLDGRLRPDQLGVLPLWRGAVLAQAGGLWSTDRRRHVLHVQRTETSGLKYGRGATLSACRAEQAGHHPAA